MRGDAKADMSASLLDCSTITPDFAEGNMPDVLQGWHDLIQSKDYASKTGKAKGEATSNDICRETYIGKEGNASQSKTDSKSNNSF